MCEAKNSFLLKIAGLHFEFSSISSKILLNENSSVKYYCISNNEGQGVDYKLIYSVSNGSIYDGYQLVFSGTPDSNDFLNYKWFIYKKGEEIILKVEFNDHDTITNIAAKLSSQHSNVQIFVDLKKSNVKPISIDPLIHPLGSLLLLYLLHWKKGLLIHASGVVWNNVAVIFTGVSGIGKSTMAKLWAESGFQIINDDRLILMFSGGSVRVFNNPMPYYQQYPREGILKRIFILKQTKENYITPLTGVKAYGRVLGNFIQQFYHPELITNHLELVEDVLKNVPVAEVGFKPDKDIVEMIKKQLEDE